MSRKEIANQNKYPIITHDTKRTSHIHNNLSIKNERKGERERESDHMNKQRQSHFQRFIIMRAATERCGARKIFP